MGGLQKQIDVLVTEASRVDLVLNSDKSTVVNFRNGGFLAKHKKGFLDGSMLEVVSQCKYLEGDFLHTNVITNTTARPYEMG